MLCNLYTWIVLVTVVFGPFGFEPSSALLCRSLAQVTTWTNRPDSNRRSQICCPAAAAKRGDFTAVMPLIRWQKSSDLFSGSIYIKSHECDWNLDVDWCLWETVRTMAQTKAVSMRLSHELVFFHSMNSLIWMPDGAEMCRVWLSRFCQNQAMQT